jgi:hypothetical protein
MFSKGFKGHKFCFTKKQTNEKKKNPQKYKNKNKKSRNNINSKKVNKRKTGSKTQERTKDKTDHYLIISYSNKKCKITLQNTHFYCFCLKNRTRMKKNEHFDEIKSLGKYFKFLHYTNHFIFLH